MSIDYASEKLTDAVNSMVVSDAPIRRRLFYAAMACHTLTNPRNLEDFPGAELRQRFEKWWSDMSSRPAVGEESTLEATSRELTDQDARRLAEELFSIYARVEEAYVRAHPES